jgi:hypothetical protein
MITIVLAYRLCQKSAGSAGLKTAYMQQFRTLQDKLINQKSMASLLPNKQFILDLHAWIQHLQTQGHLIVLNVDNNDDLYNMEGSIISLPYDPDSVTNGSFHDGSLRTLGASCGLVDVLAEQHSSRPFPPMYIRGKKQIDYMLVSASLQHAVERSGILPYNSVFFGDHRPCFVDFNADLLFNAKIHPFASPCQRSLQLTDPRRVNKYRDILHEQLQYHKVFEKCETLSAAISSGRWSPDHISNYEQLDTIITQSMLYAKQSCGKRYTKLYEWSPSLIKLVEAVRYWRLLLKCSKGLTINYPQY